jgi:hypothetical protein
MITVRTRLLGMMVALAGLLVAACGERPQIINYKQGTYQGKVDTPGYSGDPFNGNREAWENELRTRNRTQDEYRRMGD